MTHRREDSRDAIEIPGETQLARLFFGQEARRGFRMQKPARWRRKRQTGHIARNPGRGEQQSALEQSGVLSSERMQSARTLDEQARGLEGLRFREPPRAREVEQSQTRPGQGPKQDPRTVGRIEARMGGDGEGVEERSGELGQAAFEGTERIEFFVARRPQPQNLDEKLTATRVDRFCQLQPGADDQGTLDLVGPDSSFGH